MEATDPDRSGGRQPRILVLGLGPDTVSRLRHPALDADVLVDQGADPVDVIVIGRPTPAVLVALRRQRPHAAIVAVTESNHPEPVRLALYEAGAAAVVPARPVDVVLAHVRAVLRRATWSTTS